MPRFTDFEASPETYLRSIILFGRNVASYKFAFAQALLALAQQGKTFVALEEIAPYFTDELLIHLKRGYKQTTAIQSQFLDTCQKYATGDISKDILIQATVKLGFRNVIDAFHVIGDQKLPTQFYIDERKSRGGILLTDLLLHLAESNHTQFANLKHEIEGRWQLVETAWDMKLPVSLISVHPDESLENLYIFDPSKRRRNVTRIRDALNGYQKGRCFYCSTNISITENNINAEVDHFFPHVLMRKDVLNLNLDGVWNLVLACESCNRGEDGKFSSIPDKIFIDRLHRRNEYFITSHHPLRETLINQLGKSESERRAFLLDVDSESISHVIYRWKPSFEYETIL